MLEYGLLLNYRARIVGDVDDDRNAIDIARHLGAGERR
jgi:hypothetical protein